MNKLWKKTVLIALVAGFVSVAVMSSVITPVFATEQTSNQEQQAPTPPSDNTQQGGNNEHSGHH